MAWSQFRAKVGNGKQRGRWVFAQGVDCYVDDRAHGYFRLLVTGGNGTKQLHGVCAVYHGGDRWRVGQIGERDFAAQLRETGFSERLATPAKRRSAMQ